MTARELAGEMEAERFARFGVEQAQLRRACDIIRTVQRRTDADLPLLLGALALYPVLEFHVDREPYRTPAADAPGPLGR